MLMLMLQSYACDWDELQDGKTTVRRAPQAKAQVASGQVHPHSRYWSLAHYLGMLRSARVSSSGAAVVCGCVGRAARWQNHCETRSAGKSAGGLRSSTPAHSILVPRALLGYAAERARILIWRCSRMRVRGKSSKMAKPL